MTRLTLGEESAMGVEAMLFDSSDSPCTLPLSAANSTNRLPEAVLGTVTVRVRV